MERRDVLRGAGATLISSAGLVLSACGQHSTSNTSAPTSEDAHITWRMATSWPDMLEVIQGAPRRIAERVAAMTEGRFTIEVFPAGEIVPALDVFDAVQAGTLECGHTGVNYSTDKNEAFGILAGLPFGLTPQQQNAWLYNGEGLTITQNLFADFGMVGFPAGNTGTQMGGWFKREINDIAALQGIKMRIPGLSGKVIAQLGVETVMLPGGEIFDALKSGSIDAAEWLGPHDDEKLSLHKAAQFYYYPGWWEPGTTLHLIINKQAWDALPESYQHILEGAAYEANIAMLSEYETLNQQALARLVAIGIQLRPYNNDILLAAKKAAFELYEDIASKNDSFRTSFNAWKDFRQSIYQWSRFNELSFSLFAFERLS